MDDSNKKKKKSVNKCISHKKIKPFNELDPTPLMRMTDTN